MITEGDSKYEPIEAIKSEDESRGDGTLAGALAVAGSAVAFSVEAMLVKVASLHLNNVFELMWLCAVVRWIGLACVAAGRGVNPWPRKDIRLLVLARCFVGWGGLATATWAVSTIDLGDATAIAATAPAWASIAGALMGESGSAVGVVLSIVGVTLVAKPVFIFGGKPRRTPGYAAAFIESLFSAGVSVTLRLIGRRGGDDIAALAHANAIFNIIVSPVLMIFTGPRPKRPPFRTLAVCAAAGATGVVNQLLLSFGLQRAPAGLGSVLRSLEVVFGFFWQVVLFHREPAPLAIAGSAAVILASLAAARAHTAPRRTSLRPLVREYQLACLNDDDDDDDVSSTTKPPPSRQAERVSQGSGDEEAGDAAASKNGHHPVRGLR